MSNTIDAPPPRTYDFGHPMANFAVEHILFVKTGAATGEKGPHTDLHPAVAAFRNEEMITWIICDKVERDRGLQAVHGAVNGFGADEIVIGIDARMMVTGSEEEMEALKPGQLQRMAEEEGSDIFGITCECLIVYRAKDGWMQGGIYPYLTRLDDDGKTSHIEWLEEQFEGTTSDEAGVVMAGVVPESIMGIFEDARSNPDLVALGTATGMSEFKSRMHIDCAMIKVLSDQGFHVLYNADTDAKRKILKGSMEHGVLAGAKGEFMYGGTINDDGSIDLEDPQEDL